MKNRLLIAALYSVIGLSSLTVSGASFAQSANTSSDEALVTAVRASLASHPELKADKLDVTSKNAEVTLAGPVEDGATLYKIGLEVQKVPGVKYVINEMMPKH